VGEPRNANSLDEAQQQRRASPRQPQVRQVARSSPSPIVVERG